MDIQKNKDDNFAFLFLIIPALLLIIGYFINPYPPSDITTSLIQIPMFLGLILLLIGFLIKDKNLGSGIKIFGWAIFASFWATQPAYLYISEGGDVFNAVLCILGVFALFYFAYHEWLSIKKNKHISCVNWIAGASAVAGLIYFGIERIVIGPVPALGIPEINLAEILIRIVANHSTIVLDAIIGNAELVGGHNIWLDGHYAVTIIFACTAIQAMVIFVGMIFAMPKIDLKRRIIGILITIIPIYILNLLRNAMVAFLVGKNITDFNVAHNILSKAGALISLIVLLLIVVKIIPGVLDEIYCLIDLHKRNGPLEKFFKKIWSKK